MKLKRYGILGGDPFYDQYMLWYGYTFQPNQPIGGYWDKDRPCGYYEEHTGITFFL